MTDDVIAELPMLFMSVDPCRWGNQNSFSINEDNDASTRNTRGSLLPDCNAGSR